MMNMNSPHPSNKPSFSTSLKLIWRNYIWPLVLLFSVSAAYFWIMPLIQPADLLNISRALIILVGGILPIMIYRYFTQERLPTFFKEYKQNLRRLGLPENAQQYKDRFDAVYGSATQGGAVAPFNSPVFITTLVAFMGWTFVFYPLSSENELLLAPNPSPLAYGFLGAYIFGLGSLVRQFVTDDLQPRYYASLTNRFVIVFVLSWVVSLATPIVSDPVRGTVSGNLLLVAFFIGLFPTVGLRVIQRAATAVLGTISSGFKEPLPLSKLDGLNAYHEDRLLLEGIENLQGLVSANIVGLMLNTRFPVEQIIDWMDQALLNIHARDRYHDFRRSSLRTATDFIDAYEARNLINEDARQAWRQTLARLLDGYQEIPLDHTLALINTMYYAFRYDPNLFQIRYWRDHEFEALPEDIEYERTQADLKLMQNLPDEAIAAYDDLIRKFPNYYALRLYRGLAYSAKGDYPSAIEDYTQVIENNRTNTDWDSARQAYLYRGRAQQALGEYEEAAANYQEAIQAFMGEFPEAKMDLAVVQLTHLEQYDAALGNLSEVIESGFNEAEALANRGLARYYRLRPSLPDAQRQQELQRARADLERALRLKPGLIPFYINLAHILGEQGALAAQEKILTAALAQLDATPDDEYAYRVRLERGYLYQKQERFEEASHDFRIATQLSPDQPTAYYFLGTALRRFNQLPDATTAFQFATQIDPTLMLAYEGLGDVLLAQDAYEAARDAYITMLQLTREDPNKAAQARAHLGLGRVYGQLDQGSDAEREIKNAIALTKEDGAETYANAIYELGLIKLKMNQTAEAIPHFTDSAVLFEVYGKAHTSADAYYYLARAYIQEEKLTEARRALQSAQQRLNSVFMPGNPDDQVFQDKIQGELAQLPVLPPDEPDED